MSTEWTPNNDVLGGKKKKRKKELIWHWISTEQHKVCSLTVSQRHSLSTQTITRQQSSQDEGYWTFWIEVELSMAYHCSKFNPYCLLSCRDKSKMKCFVCQATVTLHYGQGHRHEQEYIYYVMDLSLPLCQVWMPQLKSLSEILPLSYKIKSYYLWEAVVSLSECQGHQII